MRDTYQLEMDGMTIDFIGLDWLIEFLYDQTEFTDEYIDRINYDAQSLNDGQTMKLPEMWITYYKRGMK